MKATHTDRRLLTEPELRAWLRAAGWGWLRLQRDLDGYQYVSDPAGTHWAIQPLVTGGFSLARVVYDEARALVCPQCHTRLDVDPCATIEEPSYRYLRPDGRPTGVRLRLAAAVFCSRCEYCAELTSTEPKGRTTMSTHARMTESEKDHRRDARSCGQRCATYIAHALAHQAEAEQWHKVLGAQSDHGRMWEAKADHAQIEAVRAAVLAGRWARQAQAAGTRCPNGGDVHCADVHCPGPHFSTGEARDGRT